VGDLDACELVRVCEVCAPKLCAPKLHALHTLASAGARAARSIVGDLDAPEVDALVLRYLGTIAPRPPAAPPAARPIELMAPFGARRQQTWHLQARRTLCTLQGRLRLQLALAGKAWYDLPAGSTQGRGAAGTGGARMAGCAHERPQAPPQPPSTGMGAAAAHAAARVHR